MEILKQNKTIGIIILVVLVGAGIYSMSGPSSGSGSIITGQDVATGTNAEDRELLQLLIDMRKIRLDGHIFENTTYTTLRDFSKPIIPEPIGRQDPFADVVSSGTSVSGGEDIADQVLLR